MEHRFVTSNYLKHADDLASRYTGADDTHDTDESCPTAFENNLTKLEINCLLRASLRADERELHRGTPSAACNSSPFMGGVDDTAIESVQRRWRIGARSTMLVQTPPKHRSAPQHQADAQPTPPQAHHASSSSSPGLLLTPSMQAEVDSLIFRRARSTKANVSVPPPSVVQAWSEKLFAPLDLPDFACVSSPASPAYRSRNAMFAPAERERRVREFGGVRVALPTAGTPSSFREIRLAERGALRERPVRTPPARDPATAGLTYAVPRQYCSSPYRAPPSLPQHAHGVVRPAWWG